MDPHNSKSSCMELDIGEWSHEDYVEELQHILRSPTFQSLTFSDCDDDFYLSMKSEITHDTDMETKMNSPAYDDECMPKSYLYRSTQPPLNAVHMEVQENARIPHIYNLAVDRSGTGLALPPHLSQQKDVVDETVDGLMLTEAFFASTQRSSAAAAYSQTGAFLNTKEHDKIDPLRYARNMPLPIPTPLQLSSTSTPTVVSCNPSALLNTSNPNSHEINMKTTTDAHDFKPHAPAPALIEASKIRSQFGFGSNHLVPSVPLPPPKTTLSLLTTKASVSAPHHLSVISNSTTTPTLLSAETSTSFYERKKQKAKDSRVKLNESIDKLSVAINVSGSQSKLRASKYESLNFLEYGSGSEYKSLLESRKNHVKQIMEDATKTAEVARKWDRPNFVGLAGTMIQDLNSQCEVLFTELLRMHSYLETTKQKSSNGEGENQFEIDVCQSCGTRSSTLPSSTVISIDSSFVDELGDKDELYNRSSPKRLKTSHSTAIDSLKATSIFTVFCHGDAVRTIISYIDPVSFVRSSTVCRKWRKVLHNNAGDYWLTKCIQRYGTFNVRRWEEIDETQTGIGYSSQLVGHDPYYMNMFIRMHKANVRPRCVHEGNLRLGEGKLNHIASAWVSAVVRSNGETLRSVKKTRGGNCYTSLHVVELRILLQNTGFSQSSLYIPDQVVSIDASTKRRGEEMFEITSDERLLKRITQLDGSPFMGLASSSIQSHGELCNLQLYESAVITVYIHATQCPTTEKFRQKARFMKLLMNVNGAIVPLVIRFTSPAYMNSVESSPART